MAAALLAALVAGCTATGEDFGIQVDWLQARATANGVEVRAHQEIRLSPEAREALRHGVSLRLRTDVIVRGKGEWAATEERTFSYEIRYLPLSDHYQLAIPGDDPGTRTYPRLRHVLAELGDVNLKFSGAGTVPGRYEIRMRTRLDRSGLPGPMQLPAFLSPNWKHDSGWVSGNLEPGG